VGDGDEMGLSEFRICREWGMRTRVSSSRQALEKKSGLLKIDRKREKEEETFRV